MRDRVDAERWARAKEIFSDVADLDPTERERRLAEACGQDDVLRREVESLLEAELAAPAFLDGNAPEYAAPSLSELAPRNAAETQPDPLLGGSVGPVRITEVLGHGGFGRVYLGRDTKLGRDVAVKVLRSSQRSHQESRERLRREARLLSKLDHPNICRIYGLLEEGNDDYLLLEYVNGDRLTEAAAGKDLDVRLGLSRQIADALAAAHAQGIIHRDLKPDNVLVTPEGVAKVLDLGIARLAGNLDASNGDADVESPAKGSSGTPSEKPERDGLTRLGSKLGTIRYMSPEQARGEPLTTASDLFGFGLILHEIFGGAPAYVGSGDDSLERVKRGETVPFEHVDSGLSDLVSRLLQLDPVDRPTAAEVVVRIDALLDRPLERRRRLRRRVAMAAIAVAAISVVGGWLFLRRQAAQDIATAEELLSEVKDIEWRMRAEYLSPRHDITPARDEVKEQIEALAARIETLDKRGSSRGRYALGRAALSIDDIDRARAEVQAAWEDGYQTPEVAYTMGRILARQFRDEVEWVERRYRPEQQGEQMARLQEELGAPAAQFLESAKEAQVGSPEFVEALLAVSKGDYERALDQLAKIERAWYYERDALEGWIHFVLSQQELAEGSIESMLEHLSRARDAYSRAATAGSSDPGVQIGLCRTEAQAVLRGQLSFEEAEKRGAQAVSDCEAALALDPGSVEARWALASAFDSRGANALDRGQDAEPFLAQAERLAEEGLALAPESLDLRHSLVKTMMRRGASQRLLGGDPRPAYAKGRLVAEQMLTAPDVPASYLSAYVTLELDASTYELIQGGDPVASLERAIETGKRAIAIDSESLARSYVAAGYYLLSYYQIDHGIDPEETLRDGLALVIQSLEAVPGQARSLRVLGNLHTEAHRYASLTGGAAEDSLQAGRQAYREAVAADPESAWAKVNWMNLEIQEAQRLIDEKRSPTLALRTLRELAGELAGADQLAQYESWGRGVADLLEGRWLASQGASPISAYARAEAALLRSIELGGNEPVPYLNLVETLTLRAEWNRDSGRAGVPDLVRRGLAAADRALALQRDGAVVFESRAKLLRIRAELESEPNRAETLEEADRAQSRACEINRFLPTCSPA